MDKEVKWGILGCGRIAHKFASDLRIVENTKLVAVGSKDQERASDFGVAHGVDKCYDSYEELASDPDVDVIYVATRHPQHAEATLLCLNHGKAVLCEKPFAMNEKEVTEMISLAKQKDLFLMEALWTLFIPAISKSLELIRKGTIGEVKLINADFGFVGNPDPNGRLFNKSMGGGALLDIGIYPLLLSQAVLGIPEKIDASASFSSTEIDQSCGMLLRYPSEAMAVLNATLLANTQTEAWIHGSQGSIKLHRQFHFPPGYSIYKGGELIDQQELPITGHGYAHEIIHVNECLRKGLTESPIATYDFSVNLIKILDQIRDKIALVY